MNIKELYLQSYIGNSGLAKKEAATLGECLLATGFHGGLRSLSANYGKEDKAYSKEFGKGAGVGAGAAALSHLAPWLAGKALKGKLSENAAFGLFMAPQLAPLIYDVAPLFSKRKPKTLSEKIEGMLKK